MSAKTLKSSPWTWLALLVAIPYLIVMVVTGAMPVNRQLIETEQRGVLDTPAATIDRVVIEHDGQQIELLKSADSWQQAGSDLAAETNAGVTQAVKFMHTANPVRRIPGDDDDGQFGLDPPQLRVQLGRQGTTVLTAAFGNRNTDGILQFMRIEGEAGLLLMSGFVGDEWQRVADRLLDQ